jgi:hypothetical protein
LLQYGLLKNLRWAFTLLQIKYQVFHNFQKFILQQVNASSIFALSCCE